MIDGLGGLLPEAQGEDYEEQAFVNRMKKKKKQKDEEDSSKLFNFFCQKRYYLYVYQLKENFNDCLSYNNNCH
ncbi:hypothetical protein LWM68_13820 [Niabella sp. W65]|nr:hypothetical protein [Niabella sp. W65]MCH7363731.1 hypothetical protein [Niabella sp. W65]